MLRFGEFTLDPNRREFARGDALGAVEPRVFDLLVYLIVHRHRVVGKDEPCGVGTSFLETDDNIRPD